jgi:two-component system LytT family response regulator/two-component system response regulator AlgR
MSPFRVVLADDEPLARTRLARLLREADCEVLHEFEDGQSLLTWLKEGPELDALFLDIHMPGSSGLEVAAEVAELKNPPPVVYVTAFSEHAVRAFEGQALDYILKPISADRLQKTLARLKGGGDKKSPTLDAKPPAATATRFPVKAGEGHVFLDLRKVSHFEVEDEVVWAWAQGQRHRTDWTSLAEVEGTFPSAGLMRIQRHLLLRPEAVLGLKPLDGGRASVRVGEGIDLEVSRSITPRLKELLGL